ncbi:KNL1 protein, partial [Pitta sordida]|nr:KNL1 protein [Pitta sordida]
MEKIYTDPNMENDNTEHIRGKRLSSILKAPRNPLDDLGNGNELTQEVNIEKRRKSSRRVSFANTIKVFQRDLKNSTTEVENTGMNTLLHAPIQAVVQQNDEWQEAEQAAGRAGRQDTTLLFPEEGDMEMTASHTALISRDLQSHQAEEGKIDITSFLAGLKADTSRDPTNHPGSTLDQKEEAPAVKKINFSEFLLSLKSGDNTPSPAEGPDEENVFFVPSRGSEDVAQPSGEFPEPPDTCDVTRVFRGQEGGMEMTLCEAAQVKVPFPGQLELPAIWGSISSQTVFRGDQTGMSPKCEDMEMTGNYTDIIYNDHATERDSSCPKTCEKPVSADPLVAGNRPPARGDGDIPRAVAAGVNGGAASRATSALELPPASDGHMGNVSQAPGAPRDRVRPSAHPQLVPSGERTVIFPGEDMDLTRACVKEDGKGDRTVSFPSAEDVEITRTHRAEARLPPPATPADRTIVFAPSLDDMEITASHTVAFNNRVNGFGA